MTSTQMMLLPILLCPQQRSPQSSSTRLTPRARHPSICAIPESRAPDLLVQCLSPPDEYSRTNSRRVVKSRDQRCLQKSPGAYSRCCQLDNEASFLSSAVIQLASSGKTEEQKGNHELCGEQGEKADDNLQSSEPRRFGPFQK